MKKSKQAPKGPIVELRESTGEIKQVQLKYGPCAACGEDDFLVPRVGLCGPCATGDASTRGGNL